MSRPNQDFVRGSVVAHRPPVCAEYWPDAGVLRHLIVEGDLSGYGIVNAVTHYSQDVEDYDRATEFEALGGKLIELAPTDWKCLIALPCLPVATSRFAGHSYGCQHC